MLAATCESAQRQGSSVLLRFLDLRCQGAFGLTAGFCMENLAVVALPASKTLRLLDVYSKDEICMHAQSSRSRIIESLGHTIGRLVLLRQKILFG